MLMRTITFTNERIAGGRSANPESRKAKGRYWSGFRLRPCGPCRNDSGDLRELPGFLRHILAERFEHATDNALRVEASLRIHCVRRIVIHEFVRQHHHAELEI